MFVDKLKLFHGDDIVISKHIKIHQPTLEEICEYGEEKYFSLVHTLTAVGADYKWQLDDIGIDYTKISDFELFSHMLIKDLTKDDTCILFGDLDFSKFEIRYNELNNNFCLVQIYGLDFVPEKVYIDDDTIIIDEFTYLLIIEYLRTMHYLKRNNEIPGNETTKRILIEEAKEQYELNKNKPFESKLFNYISTMVNSEGFKYNYDDVWKLKIYQFYDSIKRITKIKETTLLLQSGYSGFGVDLKKISKKELDWMGDLD